MNISMARGLSTPQPVTSHGAAGLVARHPEHDLHRFLGAGHLRTPIRLRRTLENRLVGLTCDPITAVVIEVVCSPHHPLPA